MKKLLILAPVLFAAVITHSQTIEEAKKHIYYERYESARNILEAEINKGNPSPDAYYYLGELLMKQNELAKATKVMEEGKKYFDTHNYSLKEYPLLYIGYAHTLLDTGRTSDARKIMEEAIKAGKNKNPVSLLAAARANIESKNGDPNWAMYLLKKAISKDKKNPALYVALGDAYRKVIDGSNAVVNYTKALEVDPNYAIALYKEGRIYKSQKNTEVFVDRFTRTVELDPNFAPALYELYYHYLYKDVVKAQKYFDAYIRNADADPHHAYMQTDLHFVSKRFAEAISGAKGIIAAEGDKAQPRLYKLIAYSYAATGDSVNALTNMTTYFEKQKEEKYVTQDYVLQAKLTDAVNPDKTAAITWYKKALATEKDRIEKIGYMTILADLQKEAGNRDKEAMWREKVYTAKDRPTNIDLYKWGVALYSDAEYLKADSVFALYETKYPEQIYGYLWRARCNALIDTAMAQGLAVPHYLKLIEVAGKEVDKNKATLLGAYGYLGTYEANIKKDFSASLAYFEKMLELDPGNADATKYAEMLREWVEKKNEEVTDGETDNATQSIEERSTTTKPGTR